MGHLINKFKENFLHYLFYICMGNVLLWVILKSIGVIQTPPWLEYGLPVGSFIIGFFVFYHNILKAVNRNHTKIKVLKSRFEYFEKDYSNFKDNSKC